MAKEIITWESDVKKAWIKGLVKVVLGALAIGGGLYLVADGSNEQGMASMYTATMNVMANDGFPPESILEHYRNKEEAE